jgi:hypothetical protein
MQLQVSKRPIEWLRSAALIVVAMAAAACLPAGQSRPSNDQTDGLIIDVQGEAVTFAPVGEFTKTLVQLSGLWTIGPAPNAFNELCAWAYASQPVPNPYGYDERSDLALAYINPAVSISGTYDLYLWQCNPTIPNLNPNQQIEVHDNSIAGAFPSAYVNLRQTGGAWQYLGAFYLEPHASLIVSNWHGAVAIDAFRFVFRHPGRPTPAPNSQMIGPQPSPSVPPGR